MASPAVAPVANVDLSKTESCVSITINFRMGIGRMRQIKNLKVETATQASELRHQKRLMDSPELEEIRSQDGFLKRYVESKSCWYREATRFLPRKWLNEVDRAIVAYQTIRRPKLVEAFMTKYRELEAVDFQPLREVLAENFDRSDYPASDTVEAGFVLEFNYRNVGSVNLTGMSDIIIAREQEKERSIRMQAVIEWRDAMRLAGAEMVDALFAMLKPEAGKTKKMYGCHVEHLQEFLDTLPDRDLANDVDFMKNMQVVKNAMQGVTVERLKESGNLQQYVISQLEGVRAELKTMVITSGRKFR